MFTHVCVERSTGRTVVGGMGEGVREGLARLLVGEGDEGKVKL